MFPAFLLIMAAIAYRLIVGFAIVSGSTWMSNFSPFAAIALCSAVYLPLRYKFVVPFAALILSDIALNLHYHVALLDGMTFVRYGAFALIGMIGWRLRHHPSLKTLLPASLAGSCLFYFVTNASAWLTDPGYAKGFAGLVQSLTVGLPAYGGTPTWMFFRNSLVSDALFTALFVVCMSLGKSRERAAGPEPLVRTA